MSKSLPARPNLEQLRKQAKDLLQSLKSADPVAHQRFREQYPDSSGSPDKSSKPPRSPSDGERGAAGRVRGKSFGLHDAQLVIAREYGFLSWPKLKEHVESLQPETGDPMELLKQAFHANDAPQLRQLLERFPEFKAKLNEPIGPFDSPVITNVRTREMLDVLLEAGADLNARSRWWAGGFGLLHSAAPDLATYAIQRGAAVDVHAAARLGLIDTLRQLIAAAPALVHARGGDGQLPLHFASTVAIARFLLDHGADINAHDVDHESTAAQWMIRDRTEVARYLVQRGCQADLLLAAALGDAALVRKLLAADPNCIHLRVSDEYFPKSHHRSGGTIYQWTLGWHISPHEVARQFGHDVVFRLLMERSPAEVKLVVASWLADESIVKSLLADHAGLATNLSPAHRRQVAHAARNNNAAAVRMMLAAGWPVDVLGQHRATPLHWAAFHGNAEMTREILRHNPPLELTDADFQAAPLGWAIHGSVNGWYARTGDYADTVELLLKAGAKLPGKTTGGTAAVNEILRRFGAKNFD
jgi:ankyrin repeat protein